MTSLDVQRDTKPHDRRHPAGTQQQFHAWAAVVRAAVEAMQQLAGESRAKERAVEGLLRSPNPDPTAIGRLILKTKARRLEIERVIGALPGLDAIG